MSERKRYDAAKGFAEYQRKQERKARGNARVCGPCFLNLRPDQYEPNTWIEGECVICGDITAVHRVSWAEVDAWKAEQA